MKFSIIFSADIAFQVLMILPITSSEDAWDIANEKQAEGDFEGIDHYDVVQFNSSEEMNEWILEQVKLSR